MSSFSFSKSGLHNLWDIMSNDLRWSWYDDNRNKVHNRCNVLDSSPNSPPHPGLPQNRSLVPKRWEPLLSGPRVTALSYFAFYWLAIRFFFKMFWKNPNKHFGETNIPFIVSVLVQDDFLLYIIIICITELITLKFKRGTKKSFSLSSY